jgi:protein SCO1/2
MKLIGGAFGVLVVILLTACHRQPDRTVYAVEGTVGRTYPGEARIQIAHDPIPGYMEAMTMDFDARDVAALIGLQPGDRVRFDLIITKEDGWIENVRRIRESARPREPLLAKRATWTPPLRVGDVIPDNAFTNELGKPVKLSDYRGNALAITFIFTRCPFPDYCPRMSRQMAQVRDSLPSIPNAPTNWHLFSVSFDPAHDQPQVLLNYRHNLAVEEGRWDFLTGAPDDIKRFCERFGVYFMRDRGTIDHNLMTAVIDTQGRLQRLFPGNKWQPDELIDELASAAALPNPKTFAVR